ncbi:MAG: HU family DNA-binding protein [Rhodospirillales bacterium]|nr:HU family DNA-binding protein [Acetobacter sp.]
MARSPAAAKKPSTTKQPAPAKKSAATQVSARTRSGKTTAAATTKTTETAKSASRAQAATIISLKTVFEQLGETHGLPKQLAQALQADLLAALTTHLKEGARIRMNGFGTLEVRERAARMGHNPATGESIQIKASRKIAFRPAKELKAAV